MHSYLPTVWEKHWIRASPEFGTDKGKIFIVRKALYKLKSASASFQSSMAKRFDALGFKSLHADLDVWIRPAKKPDNNEYYEYIMSYVDDILAISIYNMGVLKDLWKDGGITCKKGVIKPPDTHLGAKLQERVVARTNQKCCNISSSND